jgi:hypothetical protein
METLEAAIKQGDLLQVQQILRENPQLINEVRELLVYHPFL